METVLAPTRRNLRDIAAPITDRINIPVPEKVSQLKERASDRWLRAQVFLGKTMMRKLVTMEMFGTGVDLSLVGSGAPGMHEPQYREPIAGVVDLAVLSKLDKALERQSHGGVVPETTKVERAKKLGGRILTVLGLIAAQKAAMYAGSHAGLGENLGEQAFGKYSFIAGMGTVSNFKERSNQEAKAG